MDSPSLPHPPHSLEPSTQCWSVLNRWVPGRWERCRASELLEWLKKADVWVEILWSLRGWVPEAGNIRTTPSVIKPMSSGGLWMEVGMEPWGALEEREAKEKPTHHLFQPDLCAVRTLRSSLTPTPTSQATAHPGLFPFVSLGTPWFCSVSFILSLLAAVRPGCPLNTLS